MSSSLEKKVLAVQERTGARSMTFREGLAIAHACHQAWDWVGDRTVEQAWAECPRGDWLIWFLCRCTDVDVEEIREVVLYCYYAFEVYMDDLMIQAGEEHILQGSRWSLHMGMGGGSNRRDVDLAEANLIREVFGELT